MTAATSTALHSSEGAVFLTSFTDNKVGLVMAVIRKGWDQSQWRKYMANMEEKHAKGEITQAEIQNAKAAYKITIGVKRGAINWFDTDMKDAIKAIRDQRLLSKDQLSTALRNIGMRRVEIHLK